MRSTPGQRVEMAHGPFGGFCGTVIGVDGDALDVEIDEGGRTKRVLVDPEDLVRDSKSIRRSMIERAVEQAVQEAFDLDRRLQLFWVERALVGAPGSRARLAALGGRYARFRLQLVAQEAAACIDTLLELRAACSGLDAPARSAWWLAERERWPAERARRAAEGRLAQEARLERRFPGVLPEPGDTRAEALERRAVRAWRARRAAGLTRGSAPWGPRHPQLEAAIEACPDRPEGYLVYGDWLQEQGDPRGELMALQRDGRGRLAAARERLLLARHQDGLLGPLADTRQRRRRYEEEERQPAELKWELGFIRAATLIATPESKRDGRRLDRLVQALLALPSARFLRELYISSPTARGSGDEVALLHAALEEAGPRPTLQRLGLVDSGVETYPLAAGPLRPFAWLYPRLRALDVQADAFELDAGPPFGALEELALRTCSRAVLRGLGATAWPALRQLDLWIGRGVAAQDVLALLTPERFPRLTMLGLKNLAFADELCAALPGLALAPRLEWLDLSLGTMTDAGADALLRAWPRPGRLRAIGVEGNFLSPAATRRLRATGIGVEVGRQRRERDAGGLVAWE